MKKILAMLLAIVMVLGLFAGCADTESDDTKNTETSKNTEVDNKEESKGDDAQTGDVTLVLWGSEEDQTLLRAMADAFIAENADAANITITLGAVSEADAKDQMLNDIESGADVYAFAHDQIASLVNAGALMAIPEEMGKSDVIAANDAGSVAAATVDGELYAFPMTADNGYFMYYDKSVFTEEDITSWESMLDAAEAAGKKILFDMGNAWYSYGFFAGAGLTVTLNSDGSNTCDWASDKGVAVAEAMMKLASHPAFLNTSDSNFATLIADGTICAGVNGTWNADAAKQALGNNYGACKLPTYTLGDGTVVQTGSFSGYKMVGVNPYSKNLLWAMKLANYVTNEQNQALRFEERHLGPSNLNVAATDDVKADIALAALLEQSAFSTAQNVGGNFWSPVASLGGILAENNPDNIELIDLLTQCVEGVEAPLTDE